jgi:hypothetical protein
MEQTYIQRLSFIKYLFSIGYSQSQQPEPLYGAAILSFHDSVELFLQLSSEKLNSKQSKNFMDYWDVIDSKLNSGTLSQKESMRRLNKARVNLKHHGIIPSKLDIEAFRVTTAAFFAENCPTIFQTDFNTVSLIDFIKFERSRDLLKKAQDDFASGAINEALQNITLSFEYLLSDYENPKRDNYHRSPFFFGKSMTFLSSFHLGLRSGDRRVMDFVESVKESIESMQKALKILSFGIDYKKYVKFQSITPSVQFTLGGQAHFFSHKETLNKETVDFCVNFIIESALKLQEFDFELGEA